MSKVAREISLPRKGMFNDEISVIEQLKTLLKEAMYPHQSETGNRRAVIIIEVIEL